MTTEQSQGLEALYKATNGKSGAFVDVHRVNLSISVSTLLFLVKQKFIRRLGPGLFTLTLPGIAKVSENRQPPPATLKEG
ncbi:MAG: hypothetical protein ABI700_15295 [Chloroflexota bacterium]